MSLLYVSCLLINIGSSLKLALKPDHFVKPKSQVTIIWCNQARTRHCENGVNFQTFNVTKEMKTFTFPTEFHIDFVFVSTDNNGMELVPCRTKISGFDLLSLKVII